MLDVKTSPGRPAVIAAPLQQAPPALPFRVPRVARRFRFVALAIAAGYLIFGRAFAYVGVPGFYPGEFLIVAAATSRYSWVRTFLAAARNSPALALSATLFVLWGCVEAIRGFIGGYPLLDIAQGLPAHYYVLLLFAGISAGSLLSPLSLKRYCKWLTLATGLSAVASTIALNRNIGPVLPWGPDVAILSGAALPPFCLLAYLAFTKRISPGFLVLAAPSAAAILIGGRGSTLGALSGLLTLFPRRRKLLGSLALPVIAVLALLSVFSELSPDLGGRIGKVTPSSVAARLISVFDENSAISLAEESNESPEGLDIDAGTADWRRRLWADSIASLTTTSDWLFGHGYGPVLGDILPGETGEGYTHELRTPHNFAIFLLAYTGLVGSALYVAFLIALGFELFLCPPSFAKDAAIAAGVSAIVMSLSGNLLETPFGAVPVYVMMGVFLAAAKAQAAFQNPSAREKRIMPRGLQAARHGI